MGPGLITWDGTPESIEESIAAWVGGPALTALLDDFGLGPLPRGSLGERLEALAAASDRWDYRRGAERFQAVGETFADDRAARIGAAAAALGFVDHREPAHDAYDHVLVLGGGVLTMRARADLAAGVLRGRVGTGTIAGLGSMRPLDDPQCPTEGDAVDAALRRAFGLGRPTGIRDGVSELGQPWWIRSWGEDVHVLAAPSTRGGLRANTGDTLVGWAELVQPDTRGARLLLVTTDIFVPFQHCDAIRLLGLGHGCFIDTIGFSTADNPWVKTPQTFQILQEVRSAVLSMRALYRALR
jgi:hypothetical protein